MKQFPFLSPAIGLKVFRTAVPILLIIHGTTRITGGSVNGFGEFLSGTGFPLGLLMAWCITLFEILGSLSIILGYFVPIICLGFIVELTAGIVMVHFNNGWFVVGGGSGGMEYSILLILSFFVIAVTNPSKSKS